MSNENQQEKPKRGFAAMTKEQRREIAAMGGKRAHELGRGHVFTLEQVRKGGLKGGKAISKIPGEMATRGRKGGKASGITRARQKAVKPAAE